MKHSKLNQFLYLTPEVAEALANNKPVVALESTIISHGMPYPENVETALEVERIVRETVAEVGATSPKEMGKVMKAVMPKLKGQADGKLVKDTVSRVLQG